MNDAEIIVALVRKVGELRSHNKKLARALRRIEWQPVYDPETNEVLGHFCLWCYRKPHAPNCERQAVLGDE